MSRQIEYPPSTPGTPVYRPSAGEERVLAFFSATLNRDWTLYLHPPLNGLNPDLVLLNSRNGIGVFQIRDWHDEEVRSMPDSGAFEQALAVLRLAADEIFTLYCPSLSKQALANGKPAAFARQTIKCGLVCPFLHEATLQQWPTLLTEKEIQYGSLCIAGKESFTRDISALFPLARKPQRYMTATCADDIRPWLACPAIRRRDDVGDKLSPRQQKVAYSRTESGYRRIRGPAGSGKSMILACRAAYLASQGKNVLMLTYNIALIRYLRNLVDNALYRGADGARITVCHFHMLCKRMCHIAGFEERYRALWQCADGRQRQASRDSALPRLAAESIDSGKVPLYDAVFVDEAQDFLPFWWNEVARRLVCNNGERLIVADRTQDIYNRAEKWTEETMRGAGFSGPWLELEASYRLPHKAIPLIRAFGKAYLSGDINLPQASCAIPLPGMDDCEIKWVQCSSEDYVTVCKDAIFAMLHVPGFPAETPVDFLCSSVTVGRAVIREMDALPGIQCHHTFDDDWLTARQHKMALWGAKYSTCHIRATTMQSFKGMESPNIVVCIDKCQSDGDRNAVYTALTRIAWSSKGSRLTIVCSDATLQEFGKKHVSNFFFFPAASSEICNFIMRFLQRSIAEHDLYKKCILDNSLCKLQSFDFHDRTPTYENPLHRRIYYLRYAAAYCIEYYEIFKRILELGWFEKERIIKVLSLGCGAMFDAVGLKFALDTASTTYDTAYFGIDRVDWRCQETRILPNQQCVIADMVTCSYPDSLNLLIFPKSLSELHDDVLKNIADTLTGHLEKTTVILLSKRRQSSEDRKRCKSFVDEICIKNELHICVYLKDIFSFKNSPKRFSCTLYETVDNPLEKLLTVIDHSMNELAERTQQCSKNCHENRRECHNKIGRLAMRNIISQSANGLPTLNAEPELYLLRKEMP